MTDVDYWDDTLTEEISSIQKILDEVPNMTDAVDRATALEQAEDQLRSAQGTKRSFKMETRLVQDVQQRRRLESRLTKMEQELRTLKADLRALQAEQNRGELFVNADGDPDGVEMRNLDAEKAGTSMLNEASALQDKTKDSLSNTRNMIAASKEVGVETLTELERQREVIENINSHTDRMNDNLSRAEALIKQFGKRMASDKFIQCFAVINCLLLVGVVVYAILDRDGLDIINGSSAPESPV